MKFEDLQLTDYEKSELKILIGDFYYQDDENKHIRSMIRKADSTETFIEQFLSEEGMMNKNLYISLLKRTKPQKVWYAARSVLGDDCFKTLSDAGGVLIGNKDFKLIIPNSYGDGTTRVAVKDDYRNSGLLSGLFNFFTTIEGTFNIYEYDCSDQTVVKTISGRYAIYSYSGMVVFNRV